MTKDIRLSISNELRKKLEKKIKEASFDSIEEYITFVLEQILSENKESEINDLYTKEEEAAFGSAIGNQPQEIEGEDPYSEKDEEKLKKHLEERGYL